jgi:hypothetical protein
VAAADLSPSACVLRVVAYVSPRDLVGAGIPINEEWVTAVARFDGFMDLDIYALD